MNEPSTTILKTQLGGESPDDATVVMDESTAGQARHSESAGDFIGPYQLMERLGEGGFGTVWLAEQREPIHRQVALKIVKPGMDTREIVARFEAERQALALMDHPNIAVVFDAGTSKEGVPYFVMELVKGKPITDYCDHHRLDIRQRIALFIPVCHAVQHAHQKAILHRDLKPSNILVVEADGKPVPKVIDFGIAKALHASAGPSFQATLARTLDGMLVGTPLYMSPEQAGSVPDVDTRSDVYALGVILYELLAGDTPLEREEMKRAAVDEVIRMVREQEARRPSSKFMSATQLSKMVAAKRHSEPRRIGLLLRGDLDWIVLKALEKDRERRYDSANAFAEDIQRHLNDEPVSAGPPSAGYRLRKLVRRNRMAFAFGLGLFLLLGAGVTISTWQAMRANQAEAETSAKNTALQAQLEDAARTDRLTARNMHESGRDPEALAYLARAQSYTPDTVLAMQAAMPLFNEWLTPIPEFICSGHSGAVNAASFSADGTRLISASSDGTIKIWDSGNGALLATLAPEKPITIYGAEFSRDGTKIVSIAGDATAFVWDIGTGRLLTTIYAGSYGLYTADFSADGTKIVTSSRDQTARVWDAGKGTLLATCRGHEKEVRSAHFSHDGRLVITASSDGTARVWESNSGKLLVTLPERGNFIHVAIFSPDDKSILTTSGDLEAHLWSSSDGKLLATLTGHTRAGIYAAAFSPDGSRIVTGGNDFTARLWEAATGKRLLVLSGHDAGISRVRFSTDGTRIITSGDKARVWDSSSGRVLAELQGHTSVILDARLSPDGRRVVTASRDQTLRVWPSETEGLGQVLDGHTGNIRDASFSHDSRRVVTASDDGTARVWQQGAREASLTLKGHEGAVMTAQFSPDDHHIVTASRDGTARVWDSASGQPVFVLRGHDDEVNSAQFDPTGGIIATTSKDRTARIWESGTGKPIAMIEGQSSTGAVIFSPDGRYILSITGSLRESRTGNLATESRRLFVRGPSRFSPDGRLIAVAVAGSPVVSIWDVKGGKEILALRGHEQSVNTASFSPDGRRILTFSSMSGDNTARLWDCASGAQLFVMRGSGAGMLHAEFSPDGRQIVSTASDGAVQFWSAASGKLLSIGIKHGWISGAKFSPNGSRLLTGPLQGAVITSQHYSTRVWEMLNTSDPPPRWFVDFLFLLAQRKFDADGELVLLDPNELTTLRQQVESSINASHSRYAAMARRLLFLPVAKGP